MFEVLLLITLGVIMLCGNKAWNVSRDVLHPVLLFSLPLLGMYVAQPGYLWLTQPEEVLRLLDSSQLINVAGFNLMGVAAILYGAIGPSRQVGILRPFSFAQDIPLLQRLSILLGSMSLVGYLYAIYLVGGFYAAYSRAKGGGWSDIGYIREMPWLSVPAITLMAIGCRRMNLKVYTWMAIFSFPLLYHGLLGGRRGFVAAGVLTLSLSRWIATGKRPRFSTVVTGAVALGILMLALVANRRQISLREGMGVDCGVASYATKAGRSTEYIYGGGVLLTAKQQGVVYMGGRYLTVMFIRPIPSQLWSQKYAFAAKYLGIPNLAEKGSNLGMGKLNMQKVVGFSSADGAAPGLIADIFLEFSYLYVIVLFGIGRFYWFGWHRAMLGNRFWGIAYIVMTALSVYLIAQTLEAMLFRFMQASGFVVITWTLMEGKLPKFDYKLPVRLLRRTAGRRV